MVSSFSVKIEPFEGPLDLLLNLIRVNELDIFSVNLYELVDQYLSYLRQVRFKDIQDSSMFVEVAATLCSIKVRYLLPGEKHQGLNAEDVLSEEELQERLRQRLIEYEQIKQVADKLHERLHLTHRQTRRLVNYEALRLERLFSLEEQGVATGDRYTLTVLYEQMLSTLGERRPKKVQAELETITVEEITIKIMGWFKKLKNLLFQRLYGRVSSRYELVAYFLAILQLARQHKLEIVQDDFKGPIWIRPSVNQPEKQADLPEAQLYE